MLLSIICVAVGAVVGALARFFITHLSSELSHHHGFPYGTLIVNVVGCVIVGYVLTWTADHEHDRWRLLMATGFCGAFTTFSAFAYESIAFVVPVCSCSRRAAPSRIAITKRNRLNSQLAPPHHQCRRLWAD